MTSELVDHYLTVLLREADDLAETLPEWNEISGAEQDFWLFDWPEQVAMLEALEGSREDMSDGQRARYGELLDKLRALAPALEGTGLRPPSVLD